MEEVQKPSRRLRVQLSDLLSVFYHKDYTLLFVGQLVSNLGNTFNHLALAWLVKILLKNTLRLASHVEVYRRFLRPPQSCHTGPSRQ